MFGMWIKFTAVLFIISYAAAVNGADEGQKNEICEKTGFMCNKDGKKIIFCEEVGKESTPIKDCGEKKCAATDDGLFDCKDKPENKIQCNPKSKKENVPDLFTCKAYHGCQDKKDPVSSTPCKKGEFVLPLKGSPCVKADDCPFKKFDKQCEGNAAMNRLKMKNGQDTPFCYTCVDDNKNATVYQC